MATTDDIIYGYRPMRFDENFLRSRFDPTNPRHFSPASTPASSLTDSSLAGYGNLQLPGTTSTPGTPGTGFGLNNKTLQAGGSVLSGIGSLASAYADIKGLGLAEEQLDLQNLAYHQNFRQQKQAYDDKVRLHNDAQLERQAFADATHADPSLSNIRTLQLA
jgi:hypothetical protein